MVSKQKPVLIDTNVFVIDLRYKRDPHFTANQSFLAAIAKERTGFTTIVNLLEVCGILSFNLSRRQLLELWSYFQQRYSVTILPNSELDSRFPDFKLQELFDLIARKTSLGDALFMAAAQRYLSFVSTMVTWDKEHMVGKFKGEVISPDEFTQQM